MAYIELRKLGYGDQETYRKTYAQRFSSDNAVRLDFDVAGHQAFFVQCDGSAQADAGGSAGDDGDFFSHC